MNKKFLLLSVLITMVSADVKIKVENGKLNLRVGGDPYLLKPGFERSVECNVPIEITKGEGRLAIYHNDKKIKIMSAKSRSYSPAPHLCKSFWTKQLEKFQKQIYAIYYTHEQGVGGASKGITKEKSTQLDIHVKRTDKNILLYSDHWGALDLKIDLERNGKIYKSMLFTDPMPDYAYFILPVDILKEGDLYKIISNVGQPEYKGGEVLGQSGKITFED